MIGFLGISPELNLSILYLLIDLMHQEQDILIQIRTNTATTFSLRHFEATEK